MILDKKISEIMHQNVVTAEVNTSVRDIACIMDSKDIGSVLIAEDDKVVGIITERDIVRELYKGIDLSKTKAEKLMTRKIISRPPDTTIGEAIDVLSKNKFRRLPIIKNSKLLGIVTSTDICYEINNPHAWTTVGEIMRRDVATISGDETIHEALKLMLNTKSSTGRMGVGSVVVTVDGMVNGILTERDIVKYVIARDRNVKKTRISEIMSTDIITIKPDVIVCHAAELLSHYRFRHLPVINDEEHLVGMVTQTDLLGELRKEHENAKPVERTL